MVKKLTLAVLAAMSSLALADINVGVSVSATGPAASLGIPEKNTIALLPTTIGGQKVNYIVLDDATDPTAAAKNIKKLISENKVDVMIGSTTTPNSLAMMDVAVDGETPMISMAGSAIVVEPMDAPTVATIETAPVEHAPVEAAPLETTPIQTVAAVSPPEIQQTMVQPVAVAADPIDIASALAESGLVLVQTTAPSVAVAQSEPPVKLGRPRKQKQSTGQTESEPLVMVETSN